MKLAFLYAGQGSQKPQMGLDLYAEYPQVRPLFDTPVMGLDLQQLCFCASMETLSDTRYTQPAMGVFAAAVTELLAQAGVVPDYAAGLSLGEYGALHAAGVLDAETLIETLAFRAEVMSKTTAGTQSAMVAVMGLEQQQVGAAVKEAGGAVYCCNFNCPGQIVIGGERTAVQAAARICKDLGARACIPLPVSGPFHTPLMEPASRLLRERLNRASLGKMKIPVVFNATGDVLPEGGSIPDMLALQVKSPVYFEQSIRRLAFFGVDTAVEIGPGRTLSGFVRKTAPGIRTYAVEDAAGLRRAVEAIKEIREAEAG